MAADMPEEIFIGKIQGQWPLHVFENEVHAVTWLEEPGRGRRLWKATVTYEAEMALVPPVPAQLKAKGT